MKMMKTLKILGIALLACSLLFVSCKKTKRYTITVTVNDASMGSASGGGTYDENATATLTATANNGYAFVKWEDGSSENPRNVVVKGDASYMAIFQATGFDPGTDEDADGVYVKIGSNVWTVASFQADKYTMPGKLVVWLYQSAGENYPQVQGWIEIGNGSSSMIYMASEADVDASGFPLWESSALTTTIEAVDLNANTITASQNGKIRNRTTAEELTFSVKYKNAVWEATPTPAKLWFSPKSGR